jgi:opacity protein-like surface antigen
MTVRTLVRLAVLPLLAALLPSSSSAQGIDVRGYGMIGSVSFDASDTFESVIGTASGRLLGGGVEVGLPLGGLFVGVGGSRYKAEGSRVFVAGNRVFNLGIPTTVTVSPVDVTAGWRFRQLSRRVVPYIGGGWSSYRYEESADFAAPGDNVSERHSGYHLLGGVDVRITRWLGLGGEYVWTRIPDALGQDGASAFFKETDLGGSSLRLKLSIGR